MTIQPPRFTLADADPTALQQTSPRNHRFSDSDNRVAALAAELDELRSKYDAALIRLRTDRPFLPRDIERFLEAEAKARNMTTTMLIRAILEAIAEDNLFAAVLDG